MFAEINRQFFFYYFLIYNRTNIKTGVKGFLIEPYVEVNIPEIEEYYREITEKQELKTEWNFITLGNSVANFLTNPDGINRKRNQSLDLFVFNESDLISVTEQLFRQFKKFALPYFLFRHLALYTMPPNRPLLTAMRFPRCHPRAVYTIILNPGCFVRCKLRQRPGERQTIFLSWS